MAFIIRSANQNTTWSNKDKKRFKNFSKITYNTKVSTQILKAGIHQNILKAATQKIHVQYSLTFNL